LVWRLLPNGTNLSIFGISRQNRIGGGTVIPAIRIPLFCGQNNLSPVEAIGAVIQSTETSVSEAEEAYVQAFAMARWEKPASRIW